MSNTVDPEGTHPSTPPDAPPDTPVEPPWLPLKEAAPLAGVSVKTMRRRATAGKIPAEMQDGRWMVRRDALPDSAPAPEAPPAEPPVTPVPEGMQLIPLDAWTMMLEQIGHLHEAGQQLAEARERAGRAEEREAFQLERREAAEREVAQLKAQIAATQLPDIPDSTITSLGEDLEELRAHRVDEQPSEPWWPGVPDIDDAIVEEIGRAVEELRPEHRRPWWQRIWFRR